MLCRLWPSGSCISWLLNRFAPCGKRWKSLAGEVGGGLKRGESQTRYTQYCFTGFDLWEAGFPGLQTTCGKRWKITSPREGGLNNGAMVKPVTPNTVKQALTIGKQHDSAISWLHQRIRGDQEPAITYIQEQEHQNAIAIHVLIQGKNLYVFPWFPADELQTFLENRQKNQHYRNQ